ncbi:unnamed protein product [Porites evermanni]|uniref:P-type domain-containing protein n=1 Tax=Porites evermanni TaxID=104178 RepID=A0ABN8PM22_9CNID|nr:unnamed protein product [Porites evermanni]
MKGIFQSVIYIFGAALIVTCMPSLNDQDICDIKPKNRNECGWFGIDQGTCEKKGCCWDSTHQDALFCFNSKRGPLPLANIPSLSLNSTEYQKTKLLHGKVLKETLFLPTYQRQNFYMEDFVYILVFCEAKVSDRAWVLKYQLECDKREFLWANHYTKIFCFCVHIDNPRFGCRIYHSIGGICKYICDKNERKIYGLSQCKGRICCVK